MNELPLDRHPLEALAEEFMARQRRGERPSIEEYTSRCPEHAGDIRDLFPAVMVMERLRAEPPQENLADPARLEQLGDYRLLREVGRGGMGIVYEADQLSLHRRVAVKVLPRHALLEPNQLQRFYREAKAAARLHHSNIVPVYGAAQHEGLPYYVMQLIAGHSLDELLTHAKLHGTRAKEKDFSTGPVVVPDRNSPLAATVAEDHKASTTPEGDDKENSLLPPRLPPALDNPEFVNPLAGLTAADGDNFRAHCRTVTSIGIQTAEALEYAHQQGVLHRDIKPSNLMLGIRQPVSGNGQKADASCLMSHACVWITDFGLAKMTLSSSEEDRQLTETGSLIGTVRYMAPERFREPGDARSDIYGLGLTLYELLTGRPAFDAQDLLKLMDQVTKEEPPRLRKLNPNIPPDLETIVTKAIEKDPRRRYATAGEMAEDLQRFHDDRPIHARRVGVAERSWRTCRRNPLVTGLAAALVGLITLGTTVSFAVVFREMEKAVSSEQVERQKSEEMRRVNLQLSQTKERLQRMNYVANLNLAALAWESPNGLLRVKERLRLLEPRQPDDLDLRSFEWHYLNRLCSPERLILKGHQESITSVACNGDGSRIASASFDGVVRIWDGRTGDELHCLNAHRKPGGSQVVFSPDGKTLATAGGVVGAVRWTGGDVIRLWNTATGQERGSIIPQEKVRLHHFAYTPDGRQLVATAFRQASGAGTQALREATPPCLKVWTLETGEEATILVEHCGGALGVSPDGNRLAVCAPRGPGFIVDAKDGNELLALETQPLQFKDGPPFLNSLAFSPDGRFVAGGHAYGVLVWDAVTGKEVMRSAERLSGIEQVAYSPDGHIIAAAANYESSAILFDAKKGHELMTLRGHEQAVQKVAYLPDGTGLVTGSGDDTVAVWDLQRERNPMRFRYSRDGSIIAVAMSADASRVVGTQQLPLNTHCRFFTQLWDTRAGRVLWSGEGKVGETIAVVGSTERFVTWPGGSSFTVRDLATGEPVFTGQEPGTSLHEVLLSADGRWLVTIGAPNGNGNQIRLMLRNGQTGELARTLERDQPGLIIGAAFIAGAEQLVVTSANTFGESPPINTVVIDLATGTPLVVWQSVPTDKLGPLSAAVSPDAKLLATTHKDQTIRIWDLQTGKLLHQLRGHTNVVKQATFSPDGNRLVSCGFDNTVKIWDLSTGEELLTLREKTPFQSVAFNARGDYLAGGCGGQVMIWDARPVPAKPQSCKQRHP